MISYASRHCSKRSEPKTLQRYLVAGVRNAQARKIPDALTVGKVLLANVYASYAVANLTSVLQLFEVSLQRPLPGI